jgi:hypothetical protein
MIAWAVSLLPSQWRIYPNTVTYLLKSWDVVNTFSDEFWRNVHAALSRIEEFLTGLYISVYHKVLLERT